MSQTDLRVLQIIKGIDIGGHSGGSEHFGIRLAQQLRRTGVNVSLCAYYRFNSLVERAWQQRLEQEGIPCFFVANSANLDVWTGIRTISRFVTERNIPLIHSHFQVGTLAGIGAKLFVRDVRLLRTAHTPLEFGADLAGRLSRPFLVQLLYPVMLDGEVGVSPNLVRTLDQRPLARLLGRKAHCIYNALDEPTMQIDDDIPPVEPFTPRGTKVPWVITSIGILNPLKRFDTVIKALPNVLKRIPQANYVLVGSGPEEKHLRDLASRLGVSDRVWFLGQRTDIPSILRHSNVFVHPSQLEAMSTVILEAMQNGVPVIASNIPGNADLIEDGVDGALFEVGDVDSLTNHICQVYQSPERAESYAKHAVIKMDQFRMQVSADQYLALYKALIERA